MGHMSNCNVAIITYQMSIVVRGIEKKLTEAGFVVRSIDSDVEKIKALAIDTAAFVFYLPDDIKADAIKLKNLVNACDYLAGEQRAVLLIGEKMHHAELTAHHKALGEHSWMDRPLDMDAFTEEVKILAASAKENVSGKKILIVDDDPAYAKMVREWLKDIYQIDIVTSGMQAITFLLKKQVDMILLDYEMPVVDGAQIMEMIKSEPSISGIPIVFLTGVGTKESIERVMRLKPHGYILKSATREDLMKNLRRLFGKIFISQ